MKIIVNHKEEDFDRVVLTVADVITLMGFTFRMLITKVNGKLVKKDERESVFLKDGDEVTVLHLISGG